MWVSSVIPVVQREDELLRQLSTTQDRHELVVKAAHKILNPRLPPPHVLPSSSLANPGLRSDDSFAHELDKLHVKPLDCTFAPSAQEALMFLP